MRILIIDDHPLFVEGLKLLLHELEASLTLDDAINLDKACSLLNSNKYNLALLDLKLNNINGLDTLKTFKATHASTPVVILSGEDSPSIVRECIDWGAMGFIPKSSTPQVLIQALKLVLAKGIYLPPRILSSETDAETERPNPLNELSQKQRAVLRCVIRGEPNKSIARELHMSSSTVKAHLSAVLQSLGARNRTEAVYIAARRGMKITF